MVNRVYNNFAALMLSGEINLLTGNYGVMLVTDTYTPDVDSHTVTGDLAATEVASSATYTGGGQQLKSKTASVDNDDNEGVFDAADVTWSNSTITASGAVIYHSGSTLADSYLVAFVDFGGNQSSSNGDFTIQWNSAGILNLSGSG